MPTHRTQAPSPRAEFDADVTYLDTARGSIVTHLDTARGSIVTHLDTARGSIVTYLDTARGSIVTYLDTARGSIVTYLDTACGSILSCYLSAGRSEPEKVPPSADSDGRSASVPDGSFKRAAISNRVSCFI